MTPMDDAIYLLTVFVAMAAVTAAERALPFVASQWLSRQRWVRDLGKFLPLAIMVLLVVHSAMGAADGRSQDGLFGALPAPEVASIALTFLLQWLFKNALVAIFSGTALYVVLINGLIPGLVL